jgi:tripartite-type tricarboxylate transporter receptor subunit TctC
MRRRSILQLASLAGLIPPGASALAQQPNAALNAPKLVVPFPAGGPTDLPARAFADALSARYGSLVQVENIIGTGVIRGADQVAKSDRDGRTALYGTLSTVCAPALFPTSSFKMSDLSAVALVGEVPMVLMVSQSSGIQNFADFLKKIKDTPAIAYGTAGSGTIVHLCGALIASEINKRDPGFKIEATPVHFRGSIPATNAMRAGDVTFVADIAPAALKLQRSGEARAIAVTSPQRMPQLPNVPTFSEVGLDGATASTWHMIWLPKGTPLQIMETMHSEINQTIGSDQTFRRRFAEMAMTPRGDLTITQTQKYADEEQARWAEIIRSNRITAD